MVCRRSERSLNVTPAFRSDPDLSCALKANGISARAKSAPTIGAIHRIGSIQ